MNISKGLIIAIIGFVIYIAILHSIFNLQIFKKFPNWVVMLLMMVLVAAYWLVAYIFFI